MASDLTAMTWREIFGAAIVGVFAAVVLVYFHDRFWYAPDDGADAHVAERILAGDVLNRDVQHLHPGYSHFLNALALRLFGDDIVVLRYPFVAMGVVQALWLYMLMLSRGPLIAASAATGLTALSFVQFQHPSPHWYALFLLIVVASVLQKRSPGSRWRLELLGFLVVLLFLFRQLTGVIVAIGVVSYLFTEKREAGPVRGVWAARAVSLIMTAGLGFYLFDKLDALGWLLYGIWPLALLVWCWTRLSIGDHGVLILACRMLAGGVVAALPLLLYHLHHRSLDSWFRDVFVAAISYNDLAFFSDQSFAVDLLMVAWQIVELDSVSELVNGIFWAALLILPAALGMTVLRFLWQSGSGGRLSPLPFLAVFYAVVALQYQIFPYLFEAIGISFAAMLWMVGRRAGWRRVAGAGATGYLVFVGLYYHAAQPLSRDVVGALRGERIDLVESGLPRVSLKIEADEAALYQRLIALIEEHVEPGEAIAAIPMNPELYWLSKRRNPYRFFNTGLGIHNDSVLEEAIQALGTESPRLVFFSPNDKYTNRYSEALMERVRAGYERIESIEPFEIYLLTAEGKR